ncbi:UDP-GlcNAc:polypeptide alpha-N-acetylglucosaminyltransferase [Angomonas deanei]|nr:UDP-GlcNAc:polypeptide alpha-N-acetylglucosaminyltransferase [Angomonas deanei]|eukprot:EPY26855.1 UDP-GlcNAc:polypeptide alpha-N-acetylglucosaminyltransferase [Angomonas deanei]
MDEKDLTTQNFNRHGTLIPREELLLDQSYPEDKIICLAGDVESVRDNYRLEAHCNRGFGPLAYRPGRGGAQEGPFRAASGCRVLSRVTGKKNALGPTYGRYVTSLFYMKQDYYMVVDSHSRFSLHFDVKMILRVFQAPTRAVLSHYPNAYTPEAPAAEVNRTVMSMCHGAVLESGVPVLQAVYAAWADKPSLGAFAAAGYMFGESGYVLANPFDPFLPHLFDGEEILYSARMWTSGYDIYCPAAVNVLHHYGRVGAKRDWGSVPAAERWRLSSEWRALYLLQRYTLRGDPSTHLQKGLRSISEEELSRKVHYSLFERYYGMGGVRTVTDYWKYTQLDAEHLTWEEKTKRWRGGRGLCPEEDAFG